ncbi:hypothetical protein MCOR17_002164 [Pyricularia oryzae]|nr:hypothetical protein MCOR17_002164 [Pyricularia oryzae]
MRFTTSVLATLIAVVAAAPAPEAASVDSNVQLATSLVQDESSLLKVATSKLLVSSTRS